MLRKAITYIKYPVLIVGIVLGLVGVAYAANINSANKWAWGTNVGWINFNPTHSQVTIDTSTGKFDGYAWGENVGWIHFQNADPAYLVQTDNPTVVTLARFVARAAGGGNGFVLPLALVALGAVGLLVLGQKRRKSHVEET